MNTVMASVLLALSLFLAVPAQADTRIVRYPIQNVLNASLNPGTRLVELTVNVMYPNGCFTPQTTLAELNNTQRSISLHHTTSQTYGDCTQAIVNIYPVAEMSRPESGTYRVWDAASSRYLGALVVTDQEVQFERSQSDPELIIKEGGNFL